jgi:hypothetical protein
MKANETYLQTLTKNDFKNYTFEGLQSLANSVINEDIEQNLKKEVYKKFYIESAKILDEEYHVEFLFNGFIYSINDYSDGGWYISIYPEGTKKDSDGDFLDEDDLGGLCTGSALAAVTFLIEDEFNIADELKTLEEKYNFTSDNEDDEY